MLSPSRTTSSRRRDPTVLGTAKPQLKIGWTEETCIAMGKLAQEDHSYRLSYEEFERYQKTLVSHTEQIGQECTDETLVGLPNSSHINEPSPPRIRRRTTRTITFSTVPKVAPVFFHFFMVAVDKNWWSSYFEFVVVGSFTADGNLLQSYYFAQYIPQVSPVRTAQSRIGVMNWLSRTWSIIFKHGEIR